MSPPVVLARVKSGAGSPTSTAPAGREPTVTEVAARAIATRIRPNVRLPWILMRISLHRSDADSLRSPSGRAPAATGAATRLRGQFANREPVLNPRRAQDAGPRAALLGGASPLRRAWRCRSALASTPATSSCAGGAADGPGPAQ